jgi:hypothetical protein
MKSVSPTGSYILDIPQAAVEDIDGRVSSYWIDGEDRCLQLSSYARIGAAQPPPPSVRLSDRLQREGRRKSTQIRLTVAGATTAAAEFTDEEGIQWLYVYVSWPDLTIFVTASGPEGQVFGHDSWLIRSIESIRRAGHPMDRGSFE